MTGHGYNQTPRDTLADDWYNQKGRGWQVGAERIPLLVAPG